MIFSELFVAFAIVPAVLAWIATGIVRRHALHKGIVDFPNARSSHIAPTARGGGVAIVLVFVGCLLLLVAIRLLAIRNVLALILSGLSIASVGYLDDRGSLPAKIRFIVHVGAAVWVVLLIGGVTELTLRNLGLRGVWVGGVVGALALAWATNLFNFMDGIDGLAASEAVFIGTAGAWLSWCKGVDNGVSIAMIALAGSSAGFLFWNWPPARIFLGDVGSGFLGFCLFALGLAASQRGVISIEVWAILGGVFVVDATVTLVRRIARGDRWLEAHRLHAYQHLARRWQSHLRVTLMVTAINVFWLLPWAWFAAAMPVYATIAVPAALVPLVGLTLWMGAGKKES